MTDTIYPAMLLADFYKISHREQYPPGTEIVYSTWIPRGSRVPGVENVVQFGIQGFIQTWLVDYFNEHFFSRDLEEIVTEYTVFIAATLFQGDQSKVDPSHIVALHDLGYLPLDIRALPEGTRTPLRVPMATVENTHPDFFWLTNFIETLWSAEVWHPSTAATVATMYRQILDTYAIETTGSTGGVDFQAHDFSIRGMTSLQSAAKSGAAHLLSFVGTDNIPGIQYLEKYYGADVEREMVGTSIPATEHSVMCAYGQDELTSYRRLITEVYPEGLVSIVSDTWDLWKVLTQVLPALKDEIMEREGKVVIRPDSGDPADIICGEWSRPGLIHPMVVPGPAQKGVIELLWDTFGGTTNAKGYKVLDYHIGAIYGDSITPERALDICQRLLRKGFASTNVVFGVGSFTYQYHTRDTFEFAMKSTWCQINGQGVQIFKDPATDVKHTKRSLKGRVVVVRKDAQLIAIDGLDKGDESAYNSLLQPVFLDGDTMNVQTLGEIRNRLQ